MLVVARLWEGGAGGGDGGGGGDGDHDNGAGGDGVAAALSVIWRAVEVVEMSIWWRKSSIKKAKAWRKYQCSAQRNDTGSQDRRIFVCIC